MKINIKGPIIASSEQWIYDWFGIEATSPQKVNDLIEKANGEDLEVIINSGGGNVYAGSEIYTALKSYQGNSTGKIVGVAASAASVAAMGVKTLLMSPTAQMMIHNASIRAEGDHRDMDHTADFLRNVNNTIANAYRIKSGIDQEELLTMMNKETWMTSKQAMDYKLIDGVMFEDEINLVANLDSSELLPPEVINKIRNTIKIQELREPDNLGQDNKEKSEEITNKLKELDLIIALR